MIAERPSPSEIPLGIQRKIFEDTLPHGALLEEWEKDLLDIKKDFEQIQNLVQLKRIIQLAGRNRHSASLRMREISEAGEPDSEEYINKFASKKHEWSTIKNHGILLGIMLRAQGNRDVQISLRDALPDEITYAIAQGVEPSTISSVVAINMRLPNRPPFRATTLMRSLAELMPEVKRFIGNPDPWPKGMHVRRPNDFDE